MGTVDARAAGSSSVWSPARHEAPVTTEARESLCVPSTTEHTRALGLQNGCRTRPEGRARIAISLQITGGRTWIRTTDLFLIREAL